MVIAGARIRKSQGSIPKSGRMWAWPIMKKVRKKSQFEKRRKVMIKI
jgi:hypothetical protein